MSIILKSYRKRTVAWALACLEALPDEFFLGGSRLMGDATSSSDWDFYIETGRKFFSGIGKVLYNLGFGVHTYSKYCDINTWAVYQSNCKDGIVQISLVKSAEKKHRVYEITREWTKDRRKNTVEWNKAYKRLEIEDDQDKDIS